MNFRQWLKENRYYLIILNLLVIAAYINSWGNEFVADDIPGILQNPHIQQFNFIFSTPPVFVKNILYFLTANIFGITPAAFRAVNILFHLGNVWLLFLLVSLLSDQRTALIAAGIAAVHPIQVEAVTWISAGQYSQYSFFVLLTLLLYTLSGKDKKFLLPAMISLVAAFLTMQIAIFLPLILLAFIISFRDLKKDWKVLIFPLLSSAVWSWLTLEGISQRMVAIQTKHYQTLKFLNPLIQVPIAIAEYLKLVFWPDGLTLYHSEMSFSQTEYFLRLIVFLLFLAIIVYGYFKKRQIFFWGSLFLISLLPTLTPLGISWIVAERYVYLSSMGIFVLIAMIINRIAEKIAYSLNHHRTDLFYGLLDKSRISYAILIPLLLVLTVRTIVRNNDWKNQDNLWLASARTSPSSPQNHNNLGDLYGRRGDLERSAAEFKKAIELNPNYADAYHNLGNTYWQMGKVDEAIANYQKAAEINPTLWQSYQNLAAIYFERGDFEKAKEWIEKAVEANPQDPNLLRNLEIVKTRIPSP